MDGEGLPVEAVGVGMTVSVGEALGDGLGLREGGLRLGLGVQEGLGVSDFGEALGDREYVEGVPVGVLVTVRVETVGVGEGESLRERSEAVRLSVRSTVKVLRVRDSEGDLTEGVGVPDGEGVGLKEQEGERERAEGE